MALLRPEHTDVFNIHPTGEQYTEFFSRVLIRTPDMEVMRFVLPAGQEMREHRLHGAVTLQCVEGLIELLACGQTVRLRESEMTFLSACDNHSLKAIKNSVLLMTLVLHKSDSEKVKNFIPEATAR